MTDTIRDIPIGVLFSQSGPYKAIGREAYFGARTAINEVNASSEFDFRFVCIEDDPGGEADRYAVLADRMMREKGCAHIIGCQTSWSRKEVLPVLERHQALLWYTTTYEGFESHDRVIYTGACPNQNVVPLFRYVVPKFGNQAYLAGSNYIWGWEINRIARELLSGYGGSVLGERYIPIGDVEVAHLISEIREKRPDFILNNLIGNSSYAFLRAYQALGREDQYFLPHNCPVLSCNLTEAELGEIGSAAEGLLSTATYFEAIDTPQNNAFIRRMRAVRGENATVSAMFAGPYNAVWLLARAIATTGSADPDTIISAITQNELQTPLGPLSIDRQTQHTVLVPYIGIARTENTETGRSGFRIVEQESRALVPDPYLVDFDPRAPANGRPVAEAVSGGDAAHSNLRLVT